MYPDEFCHQIDSGAIEPVYLFLGEGELLKEEAWRHLLDQVVPVKARQMNGDRLLAKEHAAPEVLGCLSALPMFGKKRLLMVQNIEAWPKDQLKAVAAYVAHPYPTACLVLSSTHKKGLEKLQAAAEARGSLVQFNSPTERDAPRWLQMRARQYQKRLSPQAASCLVEQLGVDLYRLQSELEKLVSYVGDSENIDLGDVKEAVISQRSFTVFELLRYVSQGHVRQAVSSLRNLLLSGESPLGILALLARQVRLIWQAKDAIERRLPSAELGRKLNLPPSVVSNYTHQAQSFSEEALYRIHCLIRDTDLAIKSTSTAPQLLLEALVLRLCQPEA
jgi:DNA polymerase III subunit delta